jgi:hypothetical protein
LPFVATELRVVLGLRVLAGTDLAICPTPPSLDARTMIAGSGHC